MQSITRALAYFTEALAEAVTDEALAYFTKGTDLDNVCFRVQTARRSAIDEALAYFTEGKRLFKEPRCLHFTLDGVRAPGFLRKV